MADARCDDPVRDDPGTGAEVEEVEEVEECASSGTRDSVASDAGPGARLRAAREARGLERDELAQALNLSPRVIRALEEDDDEQLPAATFVRGYIRSWARLVGEPVEPLHAAYEARAGRPRPTVQPTPCLEPASAAPAILHHRPGLVMSVATLVLAVAGAMALFGIWPDALAPGSAAVADDRAAPDRSVAAPGPTDPAAKNVEGAAAGFAASEPEVPGADPVGVEPSVEAASSGGSAPESVRGPDPEVPVAADVVTEVSADGAGTRVLAGGEARLSLTFTGDCWVEIRDGDDRVVHRDLHRAGQALDLLGRAPFRVRLGHAPVVELSYNDSRVPLAPHTRNDVASLVIGR